MGIIRRKHYKRTQCHLPNYISIKSDVSPSSVGYLTTLAEAGVESKVSDKSEVVSQEIAVAYLR
jgi:hypothetical protein